MQKYLQLQPRVKRQGPLLFWMLRNSAGYQSIADAKMTAVPGTEIVNVEPTVYTEGAQVIVIVTTNVSPLVGFLPTSIIPNSVMIESQVSMRLE